MGERLIRRYRGPWVRRAAITGTALVLVAGCAGTAVAPPFGTLGHDDLVSELRTDPVLMRRLCAAATHDPVAAAQRLVDTLDRRGVRPAELDTALAALTSTCT